MGNPGCGMTVGGGCSDNSGFNPGAVVATAEPAPIIFDDESSSSGFNPGVETGNSGNGNWGFNPGYGNGGNQGYNPGFNSYTPLPGYGNCFNVCGNKPNRCGDRYGGGMFSEDADPIDLYVERVAVSDQRVEETIGNMATMETVLGVEMVEETWDITQDMGTIPQSTIHHRMDLLE